MTTSQTTPRVTVLGRLREGLAVGRLFGSTGDHPLDTYCPALNIVDTAALDTFLVAACTLRDHGAAATAAEVAAYEAALEALRVPSPDRSPIWSATPPSRA